MKINTISKKVLLTSTVLLLTSTFTFAQEVESSESEQEITSESEAVTESKKDSTVIVIPAKKSEDTYEEEVTPAVTTSNEDYYEEAQVNSTQKKSSKKKSSIHNPFEGMFESKQKKYTFYDTTDLSTGTIGYGIKPRTAEIFVDPKTRKVGIQTYYQSSFFDFMFSEKDVALIAEGFEKYLADFEAHTLIKNNTMKTRKMYTSKGNCRVEWGTVKTMMNYYGDAKFHVGYEFKKNSPYFCIIVKDCKNIATDIGSNVPEKSVEVQLYFTKAQARELLDKISRERVKEELASSLMESSDDY